MTDEVLETLFLPLTSGQINLQRDRKKILILNAYPGGGLMVMKSRHDITLQNYFKPYVDKAKEAGLRMVQDISDGLPAQDYVFMCGTKNITETQGLIVSAISVLEPGGYVICAGANDEGASRYKKIFEKLGFTNIEQGSKNKARVVWGQIEKADHTTNDDIKSQSDWQKILDGTFVSKPGIFGWDKEDTGSKLLLEHINDDINGKIADFGCGYGYLSVNLCKKYENIAELYAIDADFRAIQACKDNLKPFSKRISCNLVWEDLSKASPVFDLDYVIMNPPFHEGKQTDTSLGLKFINRAHEALKLGGKLWMVANAHLPYEQQIKKLFKSSQNVYEGQGFKIICAVK